MPQLQLPIFPAGVTEINSQIAVQKEAGKYFPSLLLAFRIARVFGAPIEHVFEYRAAELNAS